MGPRLVACLLASCACYLVFYRWPGMEGLGHLRSLAATLSASVPLILALFMVERRGRGADGRRWILLLLAGVILLRLCPPWDTLIGSDDTYRYLWDGRVQAHGFNPFAHAPEAPELAHLREQRFHPNIYRPDMRTVYPGLAQIWFLAGYSLHPSGFVGWRMVLLIHELAAAWLLFVMLRERGHPPLRAICYAWSPLPVVQLLSPSQRRPLRPTHQRPRLRRRRLARLGPNRSSTPRTPASSAALDEKDAPAGALWELRDPSGVRAA